MRLWLREELREIEKYLLDLLKVIAERAENDIDYIMPGYTHLQRGQVRLAKTTMFRIYSLYVSPYDGVIGCSATACIS